MRSVRVISIGLVALALVAAVIIQPWSNPEATASQPFSGIVIARVAGEPVYLEQAAFRAEGVSTAHSFGSGLTDKPAEKTPWADLVMQSLADDIILRDQAKKMGVEIPLGNVLGYLARVAAASGGSGGWQTWLDKQGLTVPQLAMRVYMNLLGAGVYLKVTDDVGVTEAEVRAYFEKHRDEFAEKNDDIAYAVAHDDLRAALLKRRQDAAFSKWLKEQEAKPEYDIQVVEGDWWNRLPNPSPSPSPAVAP